MLPSMPIFSSEIREHLTAIVEAKFKHSKKRTGAKKANKARELAVSRDSDRETRYDARAKDRYLGGDDGPKGDAPSYRNRFGPRPGKK